jgi:hypothetical protein
MRTHFVVALRGFESFARYANPAMTRMRALSALPACCVRLTLRLHPGSQEPSARSSATADRDARTTLVMGVNAAAMTFAADVSAGRQGRFHEVCSAREQRCVRGFEAVCTAASAV